MRSSCSGIAGLEIAAGAGFQSGRDGLAAWGAWPLSTALSRSSRLPDCCEDGDEEFAAEAGEATASGWAGAFPLQPAICTASSRRTEPLASRIELLRSIGRNLEDRALRSLCFCCCNECLHSAPSLSRCAPLSLQESLSFESPRTSIWRKPKARFGLGEVSLPRTVSPPE